MINRYPGKCHICGTFHAANSTALIKTASGWAIQCSVPCEPAAKVAAPPAANVGNLSGILALFDKARQHLKFPAIELGAPKPPGNYASALDSLIGYRINIAGDQAKVPGSLTVTSVERSPEDGRRFWYGRILRDGTWHPSASAPAITDHLKAFAAEPAKLAGEYGRLTGRCCFCRQALSDERSTAVGYGKICAGRFGLAWGDRPEEFAGAPGSDGPRLEAIDANMRRHEAEADRVETLRDERSKRRARQAMERV